MLQQLQNVVKSDSNNTIG